jgi:glycosyltransferase involved in cell wall biosynthesis
VLRLKFNRVRWISPDLAASAIPVKPELPVLTGRILPLASMRLSFKSDMKTNKMKIVFYCNDTLENIQTMEYYNQDIQVLIESGHDVKVCNRYSDIPLNFDVIYIWWWTYALYPVLLAKLLGRKSIITGVFNYRPVEHVSNSGFQARPFHQRLLIKLALKMANVNLFVSKIEFDEVPSVFNLKKFYYFPCAIADTYFQNSSNSARDGLLNIAWSGKDNLRRKGVLDILDALRILKDRGIYLNCSLAGRPGDGYPELVAHISQLRKKIKFIFRGKNLSATILFRRIRVGHGRGVGRRLLCYRM